MEGFVSVDTLEVLDPGVRRDDGEGIDGWRRRRESLGRIDDYVEDAFDLIENWIPAFAGMTGEVLADKGWG